jgi:hypothetical protein
VTPPITTSPGLPVTLVGRRNGAEAYVGAVLGGGEPRHPELVTAVQRAAVLLAETYDLPVMIRWNSDGLGGGAWLVTHDGPDAVGRNSEVGVGAAWTTAEAHARSAELFADHPEHIAQPGLQVWASIRHVIHPVENVHRAVTVCRRQCPPGTVEVTR